ncbi:MAG: hypothetical protein ABR587_14055 [Candidatus Binatia bacterium]
MAESKFTSSQLELSASNVLRKLQMPALGVGGIALAASFIGALVWPEEFFRAWLVAYFYWLALALGSTALLMMQYISGGRWGAVIRRPLEAAAANVPLMALFFIPIAIGLEYLYPWADPKLVATSKVLQYKSVYLNTPFFLARTAGYFAVWILISSRLVAWSRESDTRGWDDKQVSRISTISHAGIIAWALTMSLAAIDWGMSLEIAWFSHIYGLMFAAAQILTALTLAIVVTARIADHRPISTVISSDRFHDLGKLLLAFTMVWTYFQLSQYIIMWGANLPEEVEWYIIRNQGGWEFLTLFLFLFHFVVPFSLLLSQSRKKKPMSIAAVATLLLVMRYVDIFWWIAPTFSPLSFHAHPLHLTTVLGIGGIWMWRYIGTLSAHPLLAVHEPVIESELEHA